MLPFNDRSKIEKDSQKSLKRLRPRLESHFSSYAKSNPDEWGVFLKRLESNFNRLFELLIQLYGNQYDFFYHLEELLSKMARSWIDRPDDLKQLDQQREQAPDWFRSNQLLGGVCYVDLFAGDLSGIKLKIDYFKELGLNYLHLMPLFKVPEGPNDGGYAVSSYRQVNSSLGSMVQLSELASELRNQGVSLVLDFIFNHTADDHEWALRAKAGDPDYQDYYRMFPDRKIPDAYETTLREIFPEEHAGAFTFSPGLHKWVWTTFHSYQWDLNYSNPAVFNSMSEEMLFLANIGVEVLRLDAVAFTWKRMGTSCENLPEAHMLIRAFNTIARISAPAMLFKSEAIVHPDEVIKYIHPEECQLSYNPLLMAMLWNSLATRKTELLNQALRDRFDIPQGCAWVNYVRCHDDIGWTFADEDAARLGFNAYDHRMFLNEFYTGRFQGSFARGLPFQENPKTGDVRISGSCASLAGLEKALTDETDREVELAVRRILLIHGIILTIGGIPLIYLGDEIGILNDYSFRNNPAKVRDSRWVHRPVIDWEKIAQRHNPESVEGRIFSQLKNLINIRKNTSAFNGSEMQVIDSGNVHVLGYVRTYENERALVLANFSEDTQIINGNLLRLYGMSYEFNDLLSDKNVIAQELAIEPYQLLCLV